MTIERTSTTAIECRIYSDAARTTLLDTLSIALPSGRTYRYVFATNSHNSGTVYQASYTVEDLDLDPSAGGVATAMALTGAGS